MADIYFLTDFTTLKNHNQKVCIISCYYQQLKNSENND